MSEILVVYGTIEGQARRIAEFVAERLAPAFETVSVMDAAQPPSVLDLSQYAAAIVVATTAPERERSGAAQFIRAHAGALSRMPSALVSVSLQAFGGDAEDDEDVRQYVEELCAETGWSPRCVHYAAGALHFARFDVLERLAAEGRAEERGLPARDQDVELTDWRALAAFVDDFARTLQFGN
jgi:menaquinone-dependent protoporphyrinogen oxidase